MSFSSHFSIFVFRQNDEKRKNQLYCLCLKMTADFGNFVAKTDEKWKTKDVMSRAYKSEYPLWVSTPSNLQESHETCIKVFQESFESL